MNKIIFSNDGKNSDLNSEYSINLLVLSVQKTCEEEYYLFESSPGSNNIINGLQKADYSKKEINNNNKENCNVYNDSDSKTFEISLEWNIEYNTDSGYMSNLLSEIKENFFQQFQDLNAYQKALNIKTVINNDIQNLIHKKNEKIFNALSSLGDLISNKNNFLLDILNEVFINSELLLSMNASIPGKQAFINSNIHSPTGEKIVNLFNYKNNFLEITKKFEKLSNSQEFQGNKNNDISSLHYELAIINQQLTKLAEQANKGIKIATLKLEKNLDNKLIDIKKSLELFSLNLHKIIELGLINDDYFSLYEKEEYKISLNFSQEIKNNIIQIIENSCSDKTIDSTNQVLSSNNFNLYSLFMSDLFYFLEFRKFSSDTLHSMAVIFTEENLRIFFNEENKRDFEAKKTNLRKIIYNINNKDSSSSNVDCNISFSAVIESTLFEILLLNKLFSFKEDLVNFLKHKIMKVNFEDKNFILKNDPELFGNIFFNIEFSYDIFLEKKEYDNSLVMSFTVIMRMNIYYNDTHFTSQSNNNANNCNNFNNKQTNINKQNFRLITSKQINLKSFNIKFCFNKTESSTIYGKDSNNTAQMPQILDYTLVINDFFSIAHGKYSGITNNSNTDQAGNQKAFRNRAEKALSILIQLENAAFSNFIKNIFCEEFIVEKNENNFSFIHYENKRFMHSDSSNIENNQVEKEEKQEENITNKPEYSLRNNFLLNYDINNKNIFFGEIKKNIKKSELLLSNERNFQQIKNNCLSFKEYKYAYGIAGEPNSNSNTALLDFNLESNLANILNKNRLCSNDLESSKKIFDFYKHGFGFDIFANSAYFPLFLNSAEQKSENDLSYYIGGYLMNNIDNKGILSNKNYFYFGELESSNKQGFAYIFLKLENDFYLGNLKTNNFEGKGLYHYNENPVIKFYFGDFQRNLAYGKGEIIYINSDFFLGNFKESLKTLQGKYFNANKNGFFVDLSYDVKGEEEIEQTKYNY